FGTKDFWQNYPSELEFRNGSLWFHNWPRHNRPAGHTFDMQLLEESAGPARPSAARYKHEATDALTPSEWKLNVLQARYAHEGKVLDFRLPDVFGDDMIWNRMSGGRESAAAWDRRAVETVNAQGVSRTEEMWLYLTPS